MRNLKGVSVSQGGKKTSKGQEESGSVKVKLPLAPVNGKRPNVELVMLQVGSLTNFAHILLVPKLSEHILGPFLIFPENWPKTRY